ncbi:MAG TPA: translocation/assembly module TamB domain-containing protein [Kofleriaceae bacterium]|nr:translocation/assembly module TamB domain-containing protein [Kofleriaceae bacterium]
MQTPRAHRRGWRWFKRGSLAVFGFIAVAVIVAVVAMHTGWGREMVRAQVEDRLRTMFTGGATVRLIEGSPLTQLTLHDLVINGPDKRPAISVKKLTVSVGILPLLSHQARVAGVDAEDVDIDLRRSADGDLQIAHLLQPGPSSGWSVTLPSVELRRAHVRFDSGSEVMNFDKLMLNARANIPHGGPVDASLELHGTWRERSDAALDVRTSLHSDEGGMRLAFLMARAGDVTVVGTNLSVVPSGPGRAPVIGGVLSVDATAIAVERLLPGVRLPADAAVTVTATPTPGQPWTQVGVVGRIDRTPVKFNGAVDVDARHAHGELVTGTLDLSKLTSGRIVGEAAGNVSFDARPGGPGSMPVARALIRGWGAIAGVPRTEFLAAVSSAGERARATIDANGQGVTAKLAGTVHMVGDLLAIENATVHASTSDAAHASGGKAPVHGTLKVDLAASGQVRPKPSFAVTGTIDGRKLRVQDLSVASMHVAIDAGQLPNRPYGKAQVRLIDLVRGDMQLGRLDVDATDRADGKIAVAVRSRPKQNPWLFDLDALVTPPADVGGGTVAIDVQRHRVRVGNGADWTGHTGHVVIGPERIAVSNLESASALGHLALTGEYQRAGRRRGDLAASIDVKSFALDSLAGDYHGKVDAKVDLSRRGAAWQGELDLDGKGLSIEAKGVTLDTHAHAQLHDKQLSLKASASSPGVGSADIAVELATPAQIENAAAWKRLGRDAIQSGELALHGIEIKRAAELAGLEGEYAGKLDGDLKLSATTIGGRIEARGLIAPGLRGQPIGVALDLSQTGPRELTPALTVSAEGIGGMSAKAQLAMPERMFDPVAWKRLGRGALQSATVRAENIAFDPALFEKLGIESQMRGRVNVVVDVGPAARALKAEIDVSQLRGDAVVEPIDVHLETNTDERAIAASLSVASKGGHLIDLQGRLPMSIPELLDLSPEARKATPLNATAKLVETDVPKLLAVFGRTEIVAGALDGSIALTGTLGKPEVKANIVATGLKVPPGPRGKPIKTVERLTIAASWDGRAAKLDIDGVEEAGGSLKVTGAVDPAALRDGHLTVKATKFDLIPLLVFAPGPAGGASGQLDADLRVNGLDLRTTQIAGEVHLSDSRVPIAPSVGTLRRAKIDAIIADHQVTIGVDGRLGKGSVVVKGSIALDGAAPNGGKATMTLRKISPIGVVEPEITADVTANLSRDGNQWVADLVVDRGFVVVPDSRGEKLKPVGPPDDMTFASGASMTNRAKTDHAPTNPIVVAKIKLNRTRVESEEFRGDLRGQVELRADGDAIGMVGGIEADRGDLDLFGRRYYVERAGVHFDGSLDPLLDVRITHEFAEVTTITEIRGRASAPELMMSSDPGTYSQGQLLGFLLGGDPTGDPQSGAATDKVADAGASLIANKLGGYVKKALPIDVDVLRYESASASGSAAVTVGSWISHSLFLAYRQHLAARPDENIGEGQLEYWLSRRVVIEGTAGNYSQGVDLLWRKRY